MGKQKEITYNQLNQIKPVTDSQKFVFDTWKQGQNQFLFGCAGTGKTFVSLYLALSEVLRNETIQKLQRIQRNLVDTRQSNQSFSQTLTESKEGSKWEDTRKNETQDEN